MAHTATWDETTPLGSEAANLADNYIRNGKRDIRERMSLEHVWNVDTTQDGRHLFNHFVCGILTLTTGVPFISTDVLAATTIYFTPYHGNYLSTYDGTRWKTRTFTELSIAIPAAANTAFDVFVYDNAGVDTLELLAWTNLTTRATALVYQDGQLVKSGATTRLWLGSFCTTGVAGQTEDSFVKRYLHNGFNRHAKLLRRFETNSTWTYTTATIRQANGSALNQVEVFVGLADVKMNLHLQAASRNTNADILRSAGIGEDSTTTYMAQESLNTPNDGGGVWPIGIYYPHIARLTHYPAIGKHVYSWNEASFATGTTTWSGVVAPTSGTNALQMGLNGEIEG